MPPDPRPAPAAFVQPFVDEGLGNSAYLVGSRDAKLAALIDPLRDVDRYLAAAEGIGVKIAYVLDTHLHNDFVSGAREVAAKTGAVVGASAEAGLAFEHRALKDGDRLSLGDLGLGVLATPGHTPEHLAFALGADGDAAPLALFTGGALIVGGAARTDLLGEAMTEPLARRLYHTIHARLLAYPDDTAVFPTHGAGSFCAAPSFGDRTTTIGMEKARNPLCKATSEDEFVRRSLEGLPAYPAYFGKVRPINQQGPEVLGGVPHPKPMPPSEVQSWIDGGGAVLDVRSPREFLRGHIPGAYGIGTGAPLVVWAGWLLPFGVALVLVSRGGPELDFAVRQLIRIGFDDLRGTLDGGMEAWRGAGLPVEAFPVVMPGDLRKRMSTAGGPLVLDVREDDEWLDGHIPGAVHIPNGRLPWIEDLPLPKVGPIIVHCGTSNRSTQALSVLARRGFRNLALLEGGFSMWYQSGYEVEQGPGPARKP